MGFVVKEVGLGLVLLRLNRLILSICFHRCSVLIQVIYIWHYMKLATAGVFTLDEWSIRRRDLYLTTHNTHNRQISMPPVGMDICLLWVRGRDSLVGIATRYELDGPGIESRWGMRFSAPVQTGSGAYPASYTMGTGSFLVLKRPEREVDHQPHLAK